MPQMANPKRINHLRPDLRWASAAESILASRVIEVFSHERGVREGVDPEAVHDMRVALRRLQAALRLFRACYPPKRLRRYRLRLRRLLQALGAVRDQDIIIDALSHHAGASPDPVSEALARMVSEQRAARQRELASSLRLLDKLQRANFAEAMVRFVRGARRFRRGVSLGRFADEVAVIAQNALSNWNDRRREAQGRDDSETLHRMRVAVKRLRYTLELCRLAKVHEYQERVERSAEMQQILGDVHDADLLVQSLARSLPQAPIGAIGGLADIIRLTREKRQELTERFFMKVNRRNLEPLRLVAVGAAPPRRSRPRSRKPAVIPA